VLFPHENHLECKRASRKVSFEIFRFEITDWKLWSHGKTGK